MGSIRSCHQRSKYPPVHRRSRRHCDVDPRPLGTMPLQSFQISRHTINCTLLAASLHTPPIRHLPCISVYWPSSPTTYYIRIRPRRHDPVPLQPRILLAPYPPFKHLHDLLADFRCYYTDGQDSILISSVASVVAHMYRRLDLSLEHHSSTFCVLPVSFFCHVCNVFRFLSLPPSHLIVLISVELSLSLSLSVLLLLPLLTSLTCC